MQIILNSSRNSTSSEAELIWLIENKKQKCPQCGNLIGNIKGTKEAICDNCGFKDPCCE